MTVPGRNGYSFAEFASNKGCVVCAFDVLGTGDSSRPSDPGFPTELVARTNDALVRNVSERLGDGTLVSGIEPCQPWLTAAIGHSMGGFLRDPPAGTVLQLRRCRHPRLLHTLPPAALRAGRSNPLRWSDIRGANGRARSVQRNGSLRHERRRPGQGETDELLGRRSG